jgi:hypothetical protein
MLLAFALVAVSVAALPGRGAARQSAGAGQNQTTTRDTASAAISGVVIDATSGRPISGAIMRLIAGATPGQPLPPAADRQFRQITDEQGRFVFTGLAGNTTYSLGAVAFGYFDGAYGRRGPAGVGNAARGIRLLDGQWFRDARIELSRPASINGTITDEAGEPMVGVTVRIYTEIFVAGTRQLAGGIADSTDDRGRYRIANLPPGRYIVGVPSVQHAVPTGLSETELSSTTAEAVAQAEAAGRPSPLRRRPAYAIDAEYRLITGMGSPRPPPSAAGRPQVYPMVFHPASRALSEAATIGLEAGEDREGVDVRLQPVPAFAVHGRLIGPPDAVTGMTVRLLLSGTESLGLGSASATALTTGDGTFTFVNVPAGSYTTVASRTVTEYRFRPPNTPSVTEPPPPADYGASSSTSAVYSGPAGAQFASRRSRGNPRFQGRQLVTVAGQDLTDVVIPLQEGISLSGQVVFESTRTGAQPPRIQTVTAEPADGDVNLGRPFSTRRPGDQNPEFTIEGLMPGAYLLRSPIGGIVKSIMWNGRDYSHTPIDTTGGRDITGVVITLTDQTTTIAGVVRDRSGQPADAAAVIAFPAEPAQWRRYGIQPTRLGAWRTSTTGTFTLRTLPAGEYLLVAVDDELSHRWKDPTFLERTSRVAVKISIGWGETKAQDLVVQEVR